METNIKHCKKQYSVIVPYTEQSNTEVIQVNGINYTINRLPRPTKTVAELYYVFVDGIRYTTFAKFLKSIS
jgi:hypothetical protein